MAQSYTVNSPRFIKERKLPQTISASMSPSVVDLAWAAGFLEGEGAFGLNGVRKGPSQCVRATQKQLEPLHRLQRMFGGAVKERRADGYGEWRTYGVRARGIMMTLFPFLSARRRTQIKFALGAV